MVNIHNQNIQLFLITFFGKSIQDVTEEDLSQVLDLPFEGEGENHSLDLSDLPLFPNVRFIHFSDAMVSKEDIEKIKRAPRVRFTRCAFDHEEDLEQLQATSSLELHQCYLDHFDFLGHLPNLSYLSIMKPQTEAAIDCSQLASLSQVEEMVLNFCKVTHFEEMKKLTTLRSLSLIGTALPDDCMTTVEQLPNLQELFIGSQYTEWDDVYPFKIYEDYSQFTFIEEPEENTAEKGI